MGANTFGSNVEDWESSSNRDNPRNWSTLRKTLSITIICSIAFTTTLAASIYAPGHDQVSNEFQVSETVSLLPLSTYALGLAFGPMVSSPLSETYGRKFVYLLTLPLFDLFMIGCGVSSDVASLIVCRFFAGLFAAPGVSVSAVTITDFVMPVNKTSALAIFYSMPLIGSAVGPLIGGLVVEQRGWRWTVWIALMFGAASHVPVLYLQESYKTVIMKRSDRGICRQVSVGLSRQAKQTLRTFLTTTVTRPLHMLFTEPLLGFVCLYTGFLFALLYTFVVASPWVFMTAYSFSVREQSLSFISLAVGSLLAALILILTDHVQRRLQFSGDGPAENHAVRLPNLQPEVQLNGALYGSLVLPLSLFWFGWTADGSIHWISPVIAQAMAMLGSLLIYIPCQSYLLEVFGSEYGASSAGASSLTRYTLSAAFPLFVIPVYEALGSKWASSLLGCISLVLAAIPWGFYRYGPQLRARSSYHRSF